LTSPPICRKQKGWVWPSGSMLFNHRSALQRLRGRHVLITGGSEGIGLEVARICAKHGSRITLVARSLDKLERAVKELQDQSGTDVAVGHQQADVGSAEQVRSAVRTAAVARGPIDICICCAGACIPKYFEALEASDFEHMMRVNYFGVMLVAKEVLPTMVTRDRERRPGDPPFMFCAVSSMAAAVPFVGYAAYSPAKAATRALMDVLRNEYADTGVTLHIAFPPDTDTPGFSQENTTKPWETSHAWPACFNEVFEAKQVAECLLKGMLRGQYFVTSPDHFGNLLVSRAWGHYPRGFMRSIMECLLSPFAVLLHCWMVWFVDRVVKRRAHHSNDASS